MFRAIRNLTMALAAATTVATFNVASIEPASALPGFGQSAGYRPSARPWINTWGRPGNSTYNRPWVNRPQYRPYWPRYGFNRYPSRWWPHAHFVRWHRPHVHVAPVVTTYATRTYAATPSYAPAPANPPAPTYAAPPAPAAPAANPCLTKEYSQDGLVVFRDVCTREMTSAPNGPAQAGLTPAQPAPTHYGPAPQPPMR